MAYIEEAQATIGLGGASSGKPPRPRSTASGEVMDRAERLRCRMEDLTGRLVSKLEPVMRPSQPEKDCAVGQPEEVYPPYFDDMRSIIRRTELYVDIINSALDRVEF